MNAVLEQGFCLPDLSIMVVDDNRAMLEMISGSLQREGIKNISTYLGGNDALAHFKRDPHIDILILDLNMPDIDGIQMLRALVAMNFAGGVLLFSGEEGRILKTVQNLACAYGLHVIGTLAKPVPPRQLREILLAYTPRKPKTNVPGAVNITLEELQAAIAQRNIVPYFQPKILVKDKSLAAAEVLARWLHPAKGLILPDTFIPLAEENGLIDELTWLVYDQAFSCLAKWRATDPDFRLGLNLSVSSLGRVDLPEKLEQLASLYGIPCDAIKLEITESRLMQNIVMTLDVLSRLCLKGFHLSIDDFGTGYSSLSQLSLFPFSELKIDRSFVHNSAFNPAARAILETSATLAKKLELTIVAEGIENEEDWSQVKKAGCDLAQGYFIARPMSGNDFDGWKMLKGKGEIIQDSNAT